MSFSDSGEFIRDGQKPSRPKRLVRNKLDHGEDTRPEGRLFTEFLSFNCFAADISSQQSGQQLFDFAGCHAVRETCELPVDNGGQLDQLELF